MGQNKDTGQKKHSGPGRPLLPESKKKKSRSLTVSDQAWEALGTILQDLKLRSVSDLLEKIGLRQLLVLPVNQTSPNALANVPIYQRLKLLMQPPIAVFWSLLAFVSRTAQQLALDISEDLLCDVVKRSFFVVFGVSYTHPDTYLNNPSACLRWVCYRILLFEAEKQKAQAPERHKQSQEISPRSLPTGLGLKRISRAIEQLNSASHAPHYRVLKMKSIDGLTIGQIIRIFELQAYHKTEIEIRRMLKKGLYEFRTLWTSTAQFRKETEDPAIEEQVSCPDVVSAYYELAMLPSLHEMEARVALDTLLQATSSDQQLDFWMNEIDYHHEFTLNQDVEQYAASQEKLRKRIDLEVEEYLQERKLLLDQRIAACTHKSEIQEALHHIILQEIGCEISLKVLLASDFAK